MLINNVDPQKGGEANFTSCMKGLSSLCGGYGGNPWSDGPLSTNEDITAIEIREGHILDAIRVRYLIN